MISVGVDAAKEKSTVCVMKPFGEVVRTPFDVIHTDEAVDEFIGYLSTLHEEIRVIMEATGVYHLPMLLRLKEAGYFVTQINPLMMKKYMSLSLRKAKTDKIDAVRIANYGLDNWNELREYQASEKNYEELKLLGRQYAVRNNQDVMKMNERSIKELIRKSYTVSEGAGENGTTLSINSKNHYELMNELGFDEDQKNWAELMVKTVKDAEAEGEIELPGVSGAGGGGVNNGVSAEAYNDATFAQLMNEAEKYLGYPYVFGGSSLSTSFDCSGFVCWVYTHSGVHNLPRTTAQGIYNQCTRVTREEAKPGDLVFFQGTYNAGETVTHIGIYVGNGRMLHCGNPIQYTSIDTTYWINHFYAFGRLL